MPLMFDLFTFILFLTHGCSNSEIQQHGSTLPSSVTVPINQINELKGASPSGNGNINRPFVKTKENIRENDKTSSMLRDKSLVDHSEPSKTELLIKDSSEFVLEGGGKPQQTSTILPKNDENRILAIDDDSHSRGSKGRKGVKYPGSSVVARKGVNELNDTSGVELPIKHIISKEQNIPITTENVFVNGNESQDLQHDERTQKLKKKPEVVSDVGDSDEFDNYTIIKTSTTGEDYVIVGIVIVIGIWFSVFGALIFYRRAGEYWDRRHYRRMDFLVEGMYND